MPTYKFDLGNHEVEIHAENDDKAMEALLDIFRFLKELSIEQDVKNKKEE